MNKQDFEDLISMAEDGHKIHIIDAWSKVLLKEDIQILSKAKKFLNEMRMGGWKPIATAPKDGSTIEVSDNADGSEPYFIKWSERRICAGDKTFGPGWSQTEIPAGENLPVDNPLVWHEHMIKEIKF